MTVPRDDRELALRRGWVELDALGRLDEARGRLWDLARRFPESDRVRRRAAGLGTSKQSDQSNPDVAVYGR